MTSSNRWAQWAVHRSFLADASGASVTAIEGAYCVALVNLEFCSYEEQGHVRYVTISRPEVMNALHPQGSAEMAKVWDAFAADDDAWVAVLTGEGDRAFSAGNDLKA